MKKCNEQKIEKIMLELSGKELFPQSKERAEKFFRGLRNTNILMVGEFMGENLTVFKPRDIEFVIHADESVEYINIYSPDQDWNVLMPICKKIIEMYHDNREDIFSGLQKCDVDETFNAVVRFIEFWNDDHQDKAEYANATKETLTHINKFKETEEGMKAYVTDKNVDVNQRWEVFIKIKGGEEGYNIDYELCKGDDKVFNRIFYENGLIIKADELLDQLFDMEKLNIEDIILIESYKEKCMENNYTHFIAS